MKKACILTLLWLTGITMSLGQIQLTLQPDNYGADLSQSPYGIFFEEINHAGDGGLWSEMIRNRSFEDNHTYPEAWEGADGTTLSLASGHLLNSAQQQYLHIEPAASGASLINEGY